jgi:hypothetical protein
MVKLWDNRKGLFWMKDIWSEWDKVLHLSDDVRETVLVRWKILTWLVSHQPVSDKDTLVVRCFSDLPGPPPPGRENDKWWLEQHKWQPQSKNQMLRLQFGYLCQILVHSVPAMADLFKPLPPDGTTLIEDLPQFMNERVWNIRPTSTDVPNDGQFSASFDINLGNASHLHSEVRSIDPLTGHLLLKCISWLTGTILTSEGGFAFKQIDFDLFANLLGIYFMLADSKYVRSGKSNPYDVYHRTLVNMIYTNQPVRQRQGDASDSLTPMDVQRRIEFAGNLLSFSSSTSHFSGTKSWEFEGIVLC